MELNLAGLIKDKTGLTVKELYQELYKRDLLDYSYGNFAKKFRNDNLSGKELLWIAMYCGLDLTATQNFIKRHTEDNEDIIRERISIAITQLKDQEVLENNSFTNFSYYTGDMYNNLYPTVVWNDKEALLLFTDDQLIYGELYMHIQLDDELRSLSEKELLNKLIDEFKQLRYLGKMTDPIGEVYTTKAQDEAFSKEIAAIFPEEIGEYKKVRQNPLDMRKVYELCYQDTGFVILADIVFYGKDTEDGIDLKVVSISQEENDKKKLLLDFETLTYVALEKDGEIREDIKVTVEKLISEKHDWVCKGGEHFKEHDFSTTPKELLESLKLELSNR